MSTTKRILVVDEEAGIRDLFQKIFKKEGFEVETAENGRNALIMAREVHFDLVVMDIHMPVPEGIEAIKTLKEFSPDIKILVVTGCAVAQHLKRAIRKMVHGWLWKPFTNDGVIRMTRSVLEEHS